MALQEIACRMLLREGRRRAFTGSVLTLGRMLIYLRLERLRALASRYGTPLREPSHVELSYNPRAARRGEISDITFFEALGFDGVASLDVSEYEGATHLFDLNEPDLPETLRNQFDLVIDGGTVEHVFHVPNAMKNIFGMLKIGGRVMHASPSSNFVDHGFYMFSPTMFLDFYAANGYNIESIKLVRCAPGRHRTGPWEVFDYTPGCLDGISMGGFDQGVYTTMFVATKRAESTCDAVPQQGRYHALWKQRMAEAGIVPPPARRPFRPLARLGESLTKRVRRTTGEWTRRRILLPDKEF